MTKDQLLQRFAAAFEQFIETAEEASRRGVTRLEDGWSPREVVAHMAGWEVMASVRIPKIVAGMAPFEESDEERQTVMNNALNAAFTTLIGDQSLEAVCGILRQAYRRTIEILQQVDDRFFQPGEYVYERTASVIEHCQEHREDIAHMRAAS